MTTHSMFINTRYGYCYGSNTLTVGIYELADRTGEPYRYEIEQDHMESSPF